VRLVNAALSPAAANTGYATVGGLKNPFRGISSDATRKYDFRFASSFNCVGE